MDEQSTEPRGIHRRLPLEITSSLRERFSRRVCVGGLHECWQWLGATRNGYGCIKHSGKVFSSHVVAWRLAGNVIAPGHIVCHTCDNRLCCNPSHLYCGTPTDNILDMMDRRRVPVHCGEEIYNAKLTDDAVRKVFAIHFVRGFGAKRIAQMFGVSRKTIDSVLARETWKHVSIPSLEESQRIVLSM